MQPHAPDRLGRSALPSSALLGASAGAGTGIVHLGLGQFHRAHQAVATALALAGAGDDDWGIVGVAHRSPTVARALAEQDHLYSVLTLDPEDERADVVDVHREALVAALDPEAVIARIADPRHRVVSLTITESGYLADPQSDPTCMIGLLAQGLARRAASQAPLAVVSCDNVSSNGTTTRAAVIGWLERSGVASSVIDEVVAHTTFPNTMVDRIVPGTTDRTRARVAELLGVDDRVPVPAERFSMWVLEDSFPAGRPHWEAAGAVFSSEVDRFEDLKLLVLNGMHSLISYTGALAGAVTIPEAWALDWVKAAVHAAIERECRPVLTAPTGFDVDAWVAQLHRRWQNTTLGDRIARVGSDGSSKLPQRLPRPALGALARDEVPHLAALTTAAWICCIAPPEGFAPGPVADQMDEPLRARLVELTRGLSGLERVRGVVGAVLPGLVDHDAFVSRVAELVEVITRAGIAAAATHAVEEHA
ncbi:mannitol dehydrogenase family protein [Aestuariimicrobium soli]|uniref:mannitol dehydrogenase family protein n=1 Tax=Aestuariimicrobium soli TaxID=2035834 RepID=UPI003EC0D1A2